MFLDLLFIWGIGIRNTDVTRNKIQPQKLVQPSSARKVFQNFIITKRISMILRLREKVIKCDKHGPTVLLIKSSYEQEIRSPVRYVRCQKGE